MTEKLELKGDWQLPGNDKFISGTLTFDPVNGPKLEVLGYFPGGYHTSPNIIVGRTTSGWVTLLYARHLSSFHSHVTSVGTYTYLPSYIILGQQFLSESDLQFTQVKFKLFNLTEWVDKNGIVQSGDNTTLKIRYRKPRELKFLCYPGCKGKIGFQLNSEYKHKEYKLDIEQETEVVLEYEEPKAFFEILQDVSVFMGLATICTYQQSYLLGMRLQNKNIIDETVSKILKKEVAQPMHCYFRSSYYNSGLIARDRFMVLVPFASIAGKMNRIVTNWFKASKDFEQVHDFVLRHFLNRNAFNTRKFMDAVQAIETFHRIRHDYEAVRKESISHIITVINESKLSKKRKLLVKERLNFAHEPALKSRLKDMVKRYQIPHFMDRVSDTESFIRKVKDNRNYYTHFDERLKRKRLEGKDLFDLTQNLNIILYSAVLKNAGIDPKKLNQSFKNLFY